MLEWWGQLPKQGTLRHADGLVLANRPMDSSSDMVVTSQDMASSDE